MKKTNEKSTDWTWKFEDELLKDLDIENPERCLHCGKCVGDCTAAFVSETYNPRKILTDLFYGDSETLLKSQEIWDCFLCNNCYNLCPESIEIPLIIQKLRKFALKNNFGHDLICNLKEVAEGFINTGSIFTNKALKNKREQFGLSGERKINPKIVEKLKKISDLTGFSDIVKKLDCELKKQKERAKVY